MKPKINRLFWDIETSYDTVASFRIGGKVFLHHDTILKERAIICICYKWEHEKKVHSLEWNKGCDRELLVKFREVALQADELVAQNGDRFDVKWLNTRTLLNGLDPLPIWKTIDTLAIAKKRFYFNSNGQDYLGKLLCGQGKDKMELQDWIDIVEYNDQKAMRKMVKYCKGDVENLEKIYHLLEKYHNPKTHVGVLNHQERWTDPRTGSTNVHTNKTRVSTYGTVKYEMYSKDTKTYYTISHKAHEEYLEWKRDQNK